MNLAMTVSPAAGGNGSCPVPVDVISLRAFEKWVARGRPEHTSLLDWLEAETELGELQVLTRQVQELEHRLTDELAAIKGAQLRLSAEREVARILSVSSTISEAAPRVLQSLCESLDYAVGVLWIVDRKAAVLRCAEFFQLPTLDLCAFARLIQEQTFASGIGLAGQVWASQSPMAIPHVAEDQSLLGGAAGAFVDLDGAIAFPIGNGVETFGVMEFFSRDHRESNAVTTEMLVSIGSHINQFIERSEAEAGVRREREERRVAGCIQQGLLPRQKPVLAGYEISGRCMSAIDIGGDCFDFFRMATDADGDESFGVLVADASGHSLGAALLVAETRAYVRALSMTCPDLDRILSLVNQRITDDAEREGFVTALLLQLAPTSGSVVYTNAGHCPGIAFDRHGCVRGKLTSTGHPLGIDPTGGFPVKSVAALKPEELILLFSDGAIEACSPTGELFGIQRLLDVVQGHWNRLPEEILEAIFDNVIAFHDGHALRDDITVVVIKRQESAQGQ